MKSPNSIQELATHADYNPRFISAEAKAGLKKSMGMFGDLSGIVWNSRTKHLVAGHQRMDSLIEEHGADNLVLDQERQKVVAPDGSEFSIRIVDWDIETEKAANLAANNPFICGDFTMDAADIVREILDSNPDDCQALLLDRIQEIVILTEEEPPGGSGGNGTGKGDKDPNKTFEPSNVMAVIGPYRFEIEREKYETWLEDIRQDYGFDEKSVIEAIQEKLGL